MILKIVGLCIIFFTILIGGFYYGNLETYRLDDLSEFKKALSILKAEIEYAHAPLQEALKSIGTRTSKTVGGMFLKLDSLILKRRAEDVDKLWCESVLAFSKHTYFSKEDIENVKAFGKSLGYLDKSMQLSNIQITLNYIDETMKNLNATRIKSKKMFQSLGLLCGLLVVIVVM